MTTPTEETKKTLMQHAMQSGLYISLADIAFNLLMYFSGIEYYNPYSSTSSLPLLSYVILFGGLLYFAIQYRNYEKNGFISYGGALKHSFLTSFFYSIVLTTYSWVFLSYIAPGLERQILELTREYLLDNGSRESDVDKIMEMREKMQNYKAILSIFAITLFGTLLGLISSIFVKREQDIFEYDDENVIDGN